MNAQMAIAVVLMVIVIAIGAVLWYRGQKKIVIDALALLVHKAEVYFSAGENQAKIDFVLRRIGTFIHPALRWLWHEEWIKKQVVKILLRVEKELGYKNTLDDVVAKAKDSVIDYAESYARKSINTAVDYMTENLINANVGGDYNLVDNEQIKLLNAELKEKIGLGVNLKAFVTGETDFKGKNSAMAGLQFEKKF